MVGQRGTEERGKGAESQLVHILHMTPLWPMISISDEAFCESILLFESCFLGRSGWQSLRPSLLRNLFSFVGPEHFGCSQGRFFLDPGHSFAKKQLCPCLSSQNFPDVTRQDFPGKKYLFIWALIAHLLHPPPSYTQCGQIFHFLKSFKKKKCQNKKISKSIWLGRVGQSSY